MRDILSLEKQYTKLSANHISVSVDDLTPNELKLIEYSCSLFKEKLDDIKVQTDEVTRLSIELANLKAMTDTKDDRDCIAGGVCQSCGSEIN